jgi:hypothetical protein
MSNDEMLNRINEYLNTLIKELTKGKAAVALTYLNSGELGNPYARGVALLLALVLQIDKSTLIAETKWDQATIEEVMTCCVAGMRAAFTKKDEDVGREEVLAKLAEVIERTLGEKPEVIIANASKALRAELRSTIDKEEVPDVEGSRTIH